MNTLNKTFIRVCVCLCVCVCSVAKGKHRTKHSLGRHWIQPVDEDGDGEVMKGKSRTIFKKATSGSFPRGRAVKALALPLLSLGLLRWLRFDACPRDFHVPLVWPKANEYKSQNQMNTKATTVQVRKCRVKSKAQINLNFLDHKWPPFFQNKVGTSPETSGSGRQSSLLASWDAGQRTQRVWPTVAATPQAAQTLESRRLLRRPGRGLWICTFL